MGFGGILYYTYNKEHPKPFSNYSGPYIIEPYYRSLIVALIGPLLKGTPILIIEAPTLASPSATKIARTISPLIWVIIIVALLITLLITTHEPPSRP